LLLSFDDLVTIQSFTDSANTKPFKTVFRAQAYINTAVRFVLFLRRQLYDPLPDTPPLSNVVKAALQDCYGAHDDVAALLRAVFTPPANVGDSRDSDIAMWFLRAHSVSTGESFNVNVPSKGAVHLIYLARHALYFFFLFL
jgi:hypothetical protein